MKKIQFLLFSFAAIFMICGCENKKTEPAKDTPALAAGEHMHSDGTVHKAHEDGGHSHGEGPHGGTIADWGGGKFHAEFSVDHDRQEATVYILGDDHNSAVAIDATEITLTIKDPALTAQLKASPQEGDAEGKASRFVGTDKGLGVVKEYEGSISGAINGTPYSGKFKEVAH